MKKRLYKSWAIISLALTFVVIPVTVDLTSQTVLLQPVYAKGGGGGNGGGGNGGGGNGGNGGGGNGGNGGGNGNSGGHGGGHSSAEGVDAGTAGHGHSNGLGRGHGKHDDDTGTGLGHSHSSVSSKLGRLNAAHASPTARLNAAPHSTVGRIATYEEAINATLAAQQAFQEDPTNQALLDTYQMAYMDQEEALAAAANKDVDEEVAEAVNGLLGIETPEEPPETVDDPTEETPE